MHDHGNHGARVEPRIMANPSTKQTLSELSTCEVKKCVAGGRPRYHAHKTLCCYVTMPMGDGAYLLFRNHC